MISIICVIRTIVLIFIVILTTFRPICPPESDKKYLKKAGGHIGRNAVKITMKTRTIV